MAIGPNLPDLLTPLENPSVKTPSPPLDAMSVNFPRKASPVSQPHPGNTV